MRPYFIAGNWKMNMLPSEAGDYANVLRQSLANCRHRILIAPSFVALSAVAKALEGSNILLGAQNIAYAQSGAYTGEVSASMLVDIGVDISIIGHSERRQLFAETDEVLNTKVGIALKAGLEVIFCIGETLEEREAGQLQSVLRRQLLGGLKGFGETELSKITIAYEPVWAIGTGKTASPADANEAHAYLRTVLSEAYSQHCADAMVIQYGGSVKPENASELMAMPNIDGALVGGASLKAEDFVSIANFDNEMRKG